MIVYESAVGKMLNALIIPYSFAYVTWIKTNVTLEKKMFHCEYYLYHEFLNTFSYFIALR